MHAKLKKAPVKKKDDGLAQVAAKFLPFWPLFLFFLVVSMAGAWFYLRYTIPKYEASAKIIIKDQRKGSDDSQMMESLDMINTKKIIENEIEVLQSSTLMQTVVKALHLYAPVSQEGKINSVAAYTISPLLIESANPDSIDYFEKIPLEYNPEKGIVILNGSFTGKLDEWLNSPYGKLRFLHNDKYKPVPKEKPFYFSLIPPQSVASGILSGLKVAASSKQSSVIDLSYRDEIPKRAEDILNQLIVSYGEAALMEKSVLAKNTLSFIEERLRVVKYDLDSIEKKLQQYKSGRGAVDISRQGEIYLDNVSGVDKRLSDINMQVAVMSELEKAASSTSGTGMLPSTLGVNDPALTQQVKNLGDLQQQYDKMKVTVGENNPQLVAIREQISTIKPTILTNIQSQKRSLEQSRASLYATGGNYSSILSGIPQKERQLLEISRDQNIKQGIYSFLLQKREESSLSSVSNISDSRIVNYAQASRKPVSPKPMIAYIAAAIFALGFPLALVMGRDMLSGKILYRTDIESLTDIPIIGEIAYNKSKDTMVVEAGKRTIFVEEFRKLRASLLSLGINAEHKKLLITSNISGEGKSFISANLATSISLTGKKVVLVDMDLHNPGLGKFFNIKDQRGVSDYLIGQAREEDIIFRVPGNSNLHYISSGTLQDDASELLENGKVQHLISRLNEEFDVVVIDTAPVVLITDAYLLSSLCDATLFVIRHKFSPKVLVKRIDEALEVNPIKNPGIVFNGVKGRGFFKSNYGYGYNNYVYGYGNKKGKK